MKKVEAIVRPQDVGKVLNALSGAGYPGVMVSEIEGHGRQKGITQQWRGQEYRVDLLPKVRVEIVIPDAQLDDILNTITEVTKTGEIGDGKIFIYDVVEAVRIRTGERGEVALT